MNLNIQIGANRTSSLVSPSPAIVKTPPEPWVSAKVKDVAIKTNEFSVPQVNITAKEKTDLSSKLTGASPSSVLNNVKLADTEKTQNSGNADWTVTAKRIAVVALPIIGVLAFIGLSIGVGVATGGVGLFIPVLAGLILLSTFAASAGISYNNEQLWSSTNADSKIDDDDKNKDKVKDSDDTISPKIDVKSTKSNTQIELSKEEEQTEGVEVSKNQAKKGAKPSKSIIKPDADDNNNKTTTK